MNKLKTSIALSIVFALSTQAYQSDIDRVAEQSGASITAVKPGDEVLTKKAKLNTYNYEEVVYQRILNNQKTSSPVKESLLDKDFASGNKEAYEKRLKELAKRAKTDIEKNQQETQSKDLFTSGYCYADDEITVERLPAYAYLECDFKEPIGHKTLAVSITPDFYAKALIATPLYIDDNGKRLPVISGVVLTKDRNSINIANVINDRKVEKITATGIYTTTQTVTKYAQQYLAMKEKAATSTQTNTIATTGGTNTITATNTQEIPLDNYLVSASIEVVSSLSKVIGEAFIRNLPYTFKVYKNSVFFADLQLSKSGKLIGYKAVQKDGRIQVTEPVFSLDGKSETPKPSNIQQRSDKR